MKPIARLVFIGVQHDILADLLEAECDRPGKPVVQDRRRVVIQ